MNTSSQPAFVFVHGAWHNAYTWSKVVQLLAERGFASVTLDLPGAGINAHYPDSFNQRPLDPAAFGSEASPNADITQEERTQATIAAVKEAARLGNGKVILAGHSFGGLTVSAVAEAIPDQLQALVYLTAFMMPPGMPAIAMITSPLMADALVPQLFMADPLAVGALRIDPRSEDAQYQQLLRDSFYGDVADSDFEQAREHLHPDEPVSVAEVPSGITPERFGTLTRHYIHCTQDQAVTPAGQQEMIRLMDASMGNQTQVHTLVSSHSPFFSQPDKLVELLIQISRPA